MKGKNHLFVPAEVVRLVPSLCLLGLLFERLEKTCVPLRIQCYSVSYKIYTIRQVRICYSELNYFRNMPFNNNNGSAGWVLFQEKNTYVRTIAIIWFMDSAVIQHIYIMFPTSQAHIQFPRALHLKSVGIFARGWSEISSNNMLEQIIWRRTFTAKWRN